MQNQNTVLESEDDLRFEHVWLFAWTNIVDCLNLQI